MKRSERLIITFFFLFILIGDTTLFTITNGDRTNLMWLESPSLKLKNEFMNWFAIAMMGRRGIFFFFFGGPLSSSTKHVY